MDIGKRIKELRLANQLTQNDLAVRAGLSKGFISLVERNKSSVSIEGLLQIISVFGLALSDFFSGDSPQPYVFTTKDRFRVEGEGVKDFELLVPKSTTMAMEPCRVVLAPGETLGPNDAHIGEEFGYVIRGKVRVMHGKRSSIAGAASCFSFKADKEHSITNLGKGQAVLILVTWPPQF
jgi:transcriptional regulator with XRE-family HTH domain